MYSLNNFFRGFREKIKVINHKIFHSIPRDNFINRHIQNDDKLISEMLKIINTGNHVTPVDFIKKIIPENQHKFININSNINSSQKYPTMLKKYSERAALTSVFEIMSQNKHNPVSCIGQGYHPTWMPLVIKKNILNNPNWITAYTPYQSEISQGRLEILHNYQRMVSGITDMELSNAGLLDEANAGSEVVNFFYNNRNGEIKKRNKMLLSSNLFPTTLEAIKTRCYYLNIPYDVIDEFNIQLYTSNFWNNYFGAIFQYPNKYGVINPELFDVIESAKKQQVQIACGTDLMANLIFKTPGEIGADVAFGNTQRFGLPLGFGGPHTGFFATKYNYLRSLPGKLISKYYDEETQNDVYRMALQTREQHIKKDKATSNICTSQVLLSNINAFYAVYHGKDKLIDIAKVIHEKTLKLATICDDNQVSVNYGVNDRVAFFDTLCLGNKDGLYENLMANNYLSKKFHNKICISMSETIKDSQVDEIADIILETNRRTKTSQVVDKKNNLFNSYNSLYGDKTNLFKNDPIFLNPKTETDMVRYIKMLESKDYSLTDGMIPLGSCTMKLNATYQLEAINWNQTGDIHPYVPKDFSLGYQLLINNLSEKLLDITGMDEISYQSCSGAMGEYSGLITISNYLSKRNKTKYNAGTPLICFIPESSHGTNFASAKLAGYKIIKLAVNKDGSLSIDDLKKKIKDQQGNIGCLMMTYPSTYGIFDDNILEVIDLIHIAGGQIYLDGANMNAMCGLIKIGDLGADVCHLNLHKTFCIPHGGGGPGMGPIVVKEHLAKYLPELQHESNNYNNVIGSSQYTSASILTIPYLYLLTIDSKDLANVTIKAMINANYLKVRLEEHFDILYTNKNKLVAHEFIIDIGKYKKYGITEKDIAKRLIDYSFHPPTMSWPVSNSLMIEPTESESIAELDKFVEAMISIKNEIDEIVDGKYSETNNPLANAPHSMNDVIDWKYSYSIEKGLYPLPYLKKYKKMPSISRVNDLLGDSELLHKLQKKKAD